MTYCGRLSRRKLTFLIYIQLHRKALSNMDEDCRQMSLSYSKREFKLEAFYILSSFILMIPAIGFNVLVKTNSYQLPMNFFIKFLPFDELRYLNWALNYVFQTVESIIASSIFFVFVSLNLALLNHSCWSVDIVKLLIQKLNASLGEEINQTNQNESISNQLKTILGMHISAIYWIKDVQSVIQYTLVFDLSLLSIMICLCTFTLVNDFLGATLILIALITLFFQLLLYCWMGSRVITRIDELSEAIYDTKWYMFNVNQVKTIKLMLQANQGIKGFNGIFKPLTLETFKEVC